MESVIIIYARKAFNEFIIKCVDGRKPNQVGRLLDVSPDYIGLLLKGSANSISLDVLSKLSVLSEDYTDTAVKLLEYNTNIEKTCHIDLTDLINESDENLTNKFKDWEYSSSRIITLSFGHLYIMRGKGSDNYSYNYMPNSIGMLDNYKELVERLFKDTGYEGSLSWIGDSTVKIDSKNISEELIERIKIVDMGIYFHNTSKYSEIMRNLLTVDYITHSDTLPGKVNKLNDIKLWNEID